MSTHLLRCKEKGVALACMLAALCAFVSALTLPACKDQNNARGTSAKGATLTRPKSGPLAKGEFSLVNGEELYVRLVDEGLAEAYEAQPQNLVIEVTVSPVENGQTWKRTYTGDALKADGSWTLPGTEVGIALDSLCEGMSLADQRDDDGTVLSDVIVPGEDMIVYAVARYGKGGIDNGEGETVNSLFANVTNEEGHKTASVAALRHLVNLSSNRAADNTYSAVRIDADLAFVGNTWDDVHTVSPASRQDGKAVCPLSYLAPIELIDSANGSDGSILGNGHTLCGLVIGNEDAPVSDTGLFSMLACEVSDLTLVNTKVYGTARTGALAGSFESSAYAHECKVLVDAMADGAYDYKSYVVRGTDCVGGLVGTATAAKIDTCVATTNVVGTSNIGGLAGRIEEGSVTNCSTRAYEGAESGSVVPPLVVGMTSVGGLVGSAAGVDSLERSFAAVDVLSAEDDAAGTMSYGGLVGSIEDGSVVHNCYATGDVRSETRTGGFAGRISGSRVTDCFCTGDAYGNIACGGFVGSVAGRGVITGSASYGRSLLVTGDASAKTGGFFGALDDNDFAIDDSNAFLQEGAYNAIPSADAKRDEALPYGHGKPAQDFATADGGITDGGKLHPYDAELKDETFRFADVTGIGEMWGNWPRGYTGRWYHDNGELIVERPILFDSSTAFPGALCYAERPQNYYAEDGPYYLFTGWDEKLDDKGDYMATARVLTLPLHEFFADEPTADWAKRLRDELDKYVDVNYVSTEDFEIDSHAPGAPSNPDTFSYQIVGIKGEKPVMTIGQKLPAYDAESGQYRVLRFTVNEEAIYVGYVNALSMEKDGVGYYVYAPTLTADDLNKQP